MPSPNLKNIDLDKIPLQPQRWKFVLHVILARHNWRHATKDKGVSHKTMEERRRFCHRIFEFLRDNPIKSFKMDPRSFSGRHVEVLMTHWRQRAHAGDLGPSCLQKYHSHLSTFTSWIGKPNVLKPLSAYFDDKAMITRSYVATKSRTWRAQGVDVDEVIAEVEAYDVHAAASLRLMAAFGLRFKEACMLRPHVDVYSAAQAGKPAGDSGCYLFTHRGTKGGRKRFVPIDSSERQRAVDFARHVTRAENDSVSDPRHDLQQAIRHMRYVVERFGITKASLRVVPHGLRHQYASDEYRQATGSAPPVDGGAAPAAEVDRRARADIAEKLGHWRPQITNAYLGTGSPTKTTRCEDQVLVSVGPQDVALRDAELP